MNCDRQAEAPTEKVSNVREQMDDVSTEVGTPRKNQKEMLRT